MKNTAMAIACLTLAACGQEPAIESSIDEAVNEATPALAADGGPSVGQYRATDDSGMVLMEELRADGTYTFSGEGGVIIEEGRYDQKTPAQLCFTANADDAVEKCYDEEVGEDGIWRTTDPDTGVIAVVERLED